MSVSTIQGNFLDPEIQAYVREFVRDHNRGRARPSNEYNGDELDTPALKTDTAPPNIPTDVKEGEHGNANERTVDVVLSDMSAPWYQTTGFWKRSLSDPYNRMMNTSGDLCRAALQFSFEVLKDGGHFVCKFYQGAEDKALEKQLKALFKKVHRLKPESSRNESKESFFIGLGRKENAKKDEVLDHS
ncbi:hypothetical protein ATERTT37_006784 [Aspergillus terreus]